ncbi:hypothetical protein [Roseomonas chloroacetimidivorans]|uniref:hypothetical protein n=1 Tax=Roseomonas chloroacetimidivorans TaxID=1766656 RepID=UPI003C722142
MAIEDGDDGPDVCKCAGIGGLLQPGGFLLAQVDELAAALPRTPMARAKSRA